jgi:bifunctional non-homologous end joining protein LigD
VSARAIAPSPASRSARRDAAIVAGVRISHPDRVVFDPPRLVKRAIAEYYELAGARMFELAGRRPISLMRCPDGFADGGCFYQRHATPGFGAGVEPVEVVEADGEVADYLQVTAARGFVAAAQMGTIEFHIWGARHDDLDHPDRLVFDLDPDEGLGFGAVRSAAFELRALLEELGLATAPMVTGGKGVHLVAPLARRADWAAVTGFARGVATLLAERAPDRYTATMSKARRRGKVFIDWLRNDRGATAIAPYSVRARPGAPVAVPVDWDELARLRSGHGFGLREALARLDRPCPLRAIPSRQSIGNRVAGRLAARAAR